MKHVRKGGSRREIVHDNTMCTYTEQRGRGYLETGNAMDVDRDRLGLVKDGSDRGT